MVNEAIILAGGLGTRLRSIVKDVPKPMADINGKPFLEYIFRYIKHFGINKVILAVGYKADIIKNYFGNRFNGISIIYSEEKELLGTGGAIKQAIMFSEVNNVFIINGDTFFDIDLNKVYQFHMRKKAALTIALRYIKNADRYGIIEIDEKNTVRKFLEKGEKKEGYINGGIYLIDKSFFLSFDLPKRFSFEKDFLEKNYELCNFYGIPFDTYFVDIGVPEDYERAKKEFKAFKYR